VRLFSSLVLVVAPLTPVARSERPLGRPRQLPV
jgi:hypothetical protein